MAHLYALLAGLIFGAGLIVSEMVNPAKVQNFLDIAGSWDPSLALVMIGAIGITAPGFALARRRSQPLAAGHFQWPTLSAITPQLIGGAALFGVGWGLSGLCPGPALVNLPTAAPHTSSFVLTMLIGMAVARWLVAKGRAAEGSANSADQADQKRPAKSR